MAKHAVVVEQLTEAVENHKITDVEEIYSYLSSEDIPKEEMKVIDNYVKAAYQYWTERN